MDDQELIGHGRDFQSLDDYQKAIEYQEKRLKKAIESGDRDEERAAYRNLGNAFHSLSDYRKAIEHHVKALKIAIEIGQVIVAEKEELMDISVMPTNQLVTIE